MTGGPIEEKRDTAYLLYDHSMWDYTRMLEYY